MRISAIAIGFGMLATLTACTGVASAGTPNDALQVADLIGGPSPALAA